jgi:hypothetical protein
MVSAPAAFLRHLAALAGRQGRAVQLPDRVEYTGQPSKALPAPCKPPRQAFSAHLVTT